MGVLYVVGTPIGNLEDITLRALRLLAEVSLIVAEDTRHSRKLLSHYEISTPILSFHAHSPESRTTEIVARLADGDVALISDAGMPGVSDPGRELILAASSAGHRVEVVPGPSAVTAAVSLSGLADGGFLFAGFPPRRASERARFFRDVARCGYPVVLFESPHRLTAMLRDLAQEFPNIEIAVCRELTKMHEETFRGTVEQAAARFGAERPRGEFVLVLAPLTSTEDDRDERTDTRALLMDLLRRGEPLSQAVRSVQEMTGGKRREIYQQALELRDQIRYDENSKTGH